MNGYAKKSMYICCSKNVLSNNKVMDELQDKITDRLYVRIT